MGNNRIGLRRFGYVSALLLAAGCAVPERPLSPKERLDLVYGFTNHVLDESKRVGEPEAYGPEKPKEDEAERELNRGIYGLGKELDQTRQDLEDSRAELSSLQIKYTELCGGSTRDQARIGELSSELDEALSRERGLVNAIKQPHQLVPEPESPGPDYGHGELAGGLAAGAFLTAAAFLALRKKGKEL